MAAQRDLGPQLPELTAKSVPLSDRWLGLSTAKLVATALVVGVVVLVVSVGLDWLVLETSNRTRAIEVSDLFASLVIAALFYIYGRIRRRELLRRMETIAEMNHHIRNALQVISTSSYIKDREREVAALEEAVKRVDWALREVLPKL